MGRLFKNELLKLRYSKSIWLFLGAIIGMVILVACSPLSLTSVMGAYGYTVSFTYMVNCGTLATLFLAPIAGVLFTQEFSQGTIHNTLSCGVSRGQYFLVKTICFFAMGLLSYIISLILMVGITSLRFTFYRYSYIIPHYILVNLVYHSCTCLLLCTYMAFYILIAVSFRKAAIIVYLAGAFAVVGEFTLMDLFPNYQGILPTVLAMYNMFEQKKVLTLEFIQLFIPAAIMFIVFIVLAYLIFQKRDVN